MSWRAARATRACWVSVQARKGRWRVLQQQPKAATLTAMTAAVLATMAMVTPALGRRTTRTPTARPTMARVVSRMAPGRQ